MGREGRKQFTFTLYENNAKDRAVISFLEKISQSVRGKVIRGFVLDQFFSEINLGDVAKNEENKRSENAKKDKIGVDEKQKILPAESESSPAKRQENEEDIPNPFNDLNV